MAAHNVCPGLEPGPLPALDPGPQARDRADARHCLLISRQLAYPSASGRGLRSQRRRIFDRIMTAARPADAAIREIKMRTVALAVLAMMSALPLGMAAHAQPSQSGREVALPANPPPEYGTPLNLDQARAAAEGAMAEASKNHWHMAVTVVGPEGELIYFVKMDGTQSSSALLAQAKARTSALFRRPTKAFVDQFTAGNAAFLTFPDAARPI